MPPELINSGLPVERFSFTFHLKFHLKCFEPRGDNHL